MYEYLAISARVVDGDTVNVVLDLGFHTHRLERLRLKGIDAPELHAADPAERSKARQAKAELETLLGKGTLTVKTHQDKRDKYGRYLADLFVPREDGTQLHINSELLERGLVRTMQEPPCTI